jgi:putative transposase
MGRLPRTVIPGLPHHVTQRGNNRQDLFPDEGCRVLYLRLLRECAARHGVGIVAYGLMDNHIHLVVIPRQAASLAQAIGIAHRQYAQHVNSLCEKQGHLWQSRFFSCPLDERHMFRATRYVERNPVRAGLVARADEYPWSSARAHTGQADAAGLVWPGWLERRYTPDRWREILGADEPDEHLELLRRHTGAGEPLGSPGTSPAPDGT